MSAIIELNVQPRNEIGSPGARKLRARGLIPAIVYGHGQIIPIAFSPNELHDALGGHSPTGVLFTLKGTAGKDVTARLRDFQLDPMNGRRLLHADFQIVTRDESVRAAVTILAVGAAHGVKNFGGILDVVLHQLSVEGPAGQIPEAIEVDVTGLGIGDHLTVGELKLPKGVRALEPPESPVVAVVSSKIERVIAEAEEAAAAPAPEQQPEVITRGKEEGTA
ncbi:MAG TPA: 50S ribosomal protein L25 [Candidatus Dormibacteraeota bacterium]|nr:50S ribosomal protein L25 [Candidatus Dormibacteraeota bacterium]